MGRFVYGKHPAFGDFLTAGLSGVAQDRIESWLNASLSTLKAAWGQAWEQGFDASPTHCFLDWRADFRWWCGARGHAAFEGQGRASLSAFGWL
jgi:type VI secretion system ImpM family protein